MKIGLKHLQRVMSRLPGGLATALFATCFGAQACTEDAKRPDGFQGRQFEWENDAFARSDRLFTNGMRLSWVYCERSDQQAPVTTAALSLGKALIGDEVLNPAADAKGDRPKRAVAIVYQIGHNLYTPQYIVRADGVRNGVPWATDRPWSGLAYGSVGIFGYRGPWYHATDMKFGVAGRGSGAARVQRGWHRIIDSTYPEGWEEQTQRRWVLQVGHTRLYRFGDTDEDDRFGFHAGGAVNAGTLRSYATLLGGVSLGAQAGQNPVFAVSNEGDLVIQDFGRRGAFSRSLVFANASLTAQGTNHLITGRTVGPRPDVRLRRWVGAVQVGVSSREVCRPFGGHLYDGCARVIYTHTVRTADFESPSRPGQKPSQRTGTVSINWSIP